MIENVRAFFENDGPTAEIVLATPVVRPGEELRGCVRVQGCAKEVLIGRVGVGAGVSGPQEPRYEGTDQKVDSWGFGVGHVYVGQDVWLPANQPLDIPFTLTLPWTTPFTAVGDAVLPITAGLGTELMVHDARDPSTYHPVVIQPLPSQNRVLDAFAQLGTAFFTGDKLRAPVAGVPDLVPMLEFTPPLRYPQFIEVGVGFVADPWHLRVILTAKKYRSWLQPDSVVIGDFYMRHEAVWQVDWAAAIEHCLAAHAVR